MGIFVSGGFWLGVDCFWVCVVCCLVWFLAVRVGIDCLWISGL